MISSQVLTLLLCFFSIVQAVAPPPALKGHQKNKSSNGHNGTASHKLSTHFNKKTTHHALDTRSLFGRQEECPPGFPELCPDLLCCEADTVCCDDATCCEIDFPVCQPGGCCPTGTITCGSVAPEYCHPPDTICCEGEDINCPDDELCCGEAAPGYCHPQGTQCCEETGGNCPDNETCCGDGCCAEVDDEGDPLKCCPGTEGESVCCDEFDTCCDGYCCGEGATCTSDGECMPATLYWDDVEDGLELCENTCLGIRSQLYKDGVYYISTQWQLLQYAGPGSGSATRAEGPCEGGDCCSGVGSTYQCDEYPYASTYEGGEGAWAACIDQAQNSHQGGKLSAFLAGRHDGFQFYVYVTGTTCDSVAKDALLSLNPQCPPQVVLPY